MASAAPSPAFVRLGPETAETPLVVSAPHAGRDYPPALLAASRLGRETLQQLEDRHVDALVAPLAERGHVAIVATRARAWIDLNRSERELDPAMVAPLAGAHGLVRNARVLGGLGLIPRRLAGAGDIYRGRLSHDDLRARILECHRPFHAALAEAIAAARARFGIAILIDCHSMPPLGPGQAPHGETIVIGDREGASAARRFALAAAEACRRFGRAVAFNTPYAGGHILARHGAPARGVHAIQLEICRSLYLDAALDAPGPGFEETTALVAAVAEAMRDAASAGAQPLAAE